MAFPRFSQVYSSIEQNASGKKVMRKYTAMSIIRASAEKECFWTYGFGP